MIPFENIQMMKDSEKIYVSKDAIYIQILDYESRSDKNNCYVKELCYLTKIINQIFEFERQKMLKKLHVEMTVSEIKRIFNPYNYYPKSSFVQYIPYDEQ